MSASPYFQIPAAADSNVSQPEASGLPPKDQCRYTCNYLTPDTLIDFKEHVSGVIVASHLSCGNFGAHDKEAPPQAARGITMASAFHYEFVN